MHKMVLNTPPLLKIWKIWTYHKAKKVAHIFACLTPGFYMLATLAFNELR